MTHVQLVSFTEILGERNDSVKKMLREGKAFPPKLFYAWFICRQIGDSMRDKFNSLELLFDDARTEFTFFFFR